MTNISNDQYYLNLINKGGIRMYKFTEEQQKTIDEMQIEFDEMVGEDLAVKQLKDKQHDN